MKKHFSIVSGGFYMDELKSKYLEAGTWPNDAVAISDDDEKMIRSAISKNEVVTLSLGRWSFAPRAISHDELAREARSARDKLLSSCDYMAMPDYPLTAIAKNELSEYRRLLRDVASQSDFPNKIEWPIKPSFVK